LIAQDENEAEAETAPIRSCTRELALNFLSYINSPFILVALPYLFCISVIFAEGVGILLIIFVIDQLHPLRGPRT